LAFVVIGRKTGAHKRNWDKFNSVARRLRNSIVKLNL